jgi:hypothetical protein
MTNVGSTHSVSRLPLSRAGCHITVPGHPGRGGGTDCYEAAQGFGVPPVVKVCNAVSASSTVAT